MELRINISKVHLFVFIGVLVLFCALMFVIAQTPGTPNPGHDVQDVNGAARSCDFQGRSGPCVGPTDSGWYLPNVAIGAGIAWDSERLSGFQGDSYCRKDGSNCKPLDGNNCRWIDAASTLENNCAVNEYIRGIRKAIDLRFGTVYIKDLLCCTYP